jgi:threonine/homoserine/homoserine lactone efflux protein
MLGTHDMWTFLLASFLLWITPGPDTMYIVTRSITQGRWAGILSSLGTGTGIIVHTLFAAFGLSAILAASAGAFAAVKVCGACYLIYLGVTALFKRSAHPTVTAQPAMSGARIFRQGFITNLLNPKVAIFFLAFLPQFVDPAADLGPIPFLILGAAFVSGGTLWCILVAVFASGVTQAIRRNPACISRLDRIAGCVYIALGLNLLRAEPRTH